MQTKRKRKQWAFLAFSMIATFALQIITPLTANAEEKTYTADNYMYYDYVAISRNDEVHIDYKYAYSVVSNKPFKLVVITDLETSDINNSTSGKYGFMYMVDNADDIDFTIHTDLIEDDCKEESCTHADSVHNYTETDFKPFYDDNGNLLCYAYTSWGVYYYIPEIEPDSYTKEQSYNFILNDSYFSYKTTAENLGFTYADASILSGKAFEECAKAIYNGTLRPNGQFNESTAIYDTNIPTPKITVKNDYSFGFNNDSDGYYFQVKGRWYSVDDIELYKENFMWKYKYSSYIKSNLTDWVKPSDKILTSEQDLNFATFGKSAFDSFLSYYPVDSRSYSGSTEIRGYNDAINTIKMLLKTPETVYNGLEIYIRYYTFDENGIAHYGKWCHYFDNLANASGSSGSQWDDKENMFTDNQSQDGLTDSQLGKLESTENSRNDIDVVPGYNDEGFNSVILGNIDSSSLVTALESMYGQTKTFINMIGTVFNFLPPWIITLICASLGLVCIIGVWKCIRG